MTDFKAGTLVRAIRDINDPGLPTIPAGSVGIIREEGDRPLVEWFDFGRNALTFLDPNQLEIKHVQIQKPRSQ